MGSWSGLEERFHRGEATVAGVLSGTSADGIDVALVRFPPFVGPDLGAPRVFAFETLAFEPALAARVRAALDGEPLDPRRIALLSRDLGLAFGAAARALARRAALELDLVASHGQTVWHHDEIEESGPATLQLGDGDFVASASGAAVACDFRQGDVAAGGSGAPLSALADGVLFGAAPRPLAVLNLGGIANLTLLAKDGAPHAFDTGPAGALLDGLARLLLDAPRDEDGRAALAGTVDARLLAELLEHPFLRRPPPKSTGRDTFGAAWVRSVAARGATLGLGGADLLATAVAFVAEAVARGLAEVAPPGIECLCVAGGGWHNRALRAALGARTGLAVCSSAHLGVDPDAREALVFAVLGGRCALGIASTDPRATGARRGRVLGKLVLAPPVDDLP